MATSELCAIAACRTAVEAVQIRGVLEENGASAFIEGANAGTTLPFVDYDGVRVLVRAADVVRASKVVESLRNESDVSPEPWFCGQCRESVDGDFEVCWACGRARTHVEQPFPTPGSEEEFAAGSQRADVAYIQSSRVFGDDENQGNLNDEDSPEQSIAESLQKDGGGLIGPVLLVLIAVLILVFPIAEVPIGVVAAATGLPIGTIRLTVDLCALIAILAGIGKIIRANRRERIRRGGAEAVDLWKEALRAEEELDFEEAVRLYREIVSLHPSTTWAEDATSSIELLRKEGKI